MTENILLEETISTIRNALYEFTEIPNGSDNNWVSELTFYILVIMKVNEEKFNKFPNITKVLSENDFVFGELSNDSYRPYNPGVSFSNDKDYLNTIHAYNHLDSQNDQARSLEILNLSEENCLREIARRYAQEALTPPKGYSDFDKVYEVAKTVQEKKNVLLYYDLWYKNDIFKEEYAAILGYEPEELYGTPPSVKITSEWGVTDYDICVIPDEIIDNALSGTINAFKKIFDKNKNSSLELEF